MRSMTLILLLAVCSCGRGEAEVYNAPVGDAGGQPDVATTDVRAQPDGDVSAEPDVASDVDALAVEPLLDETMPPGPWRDQVAAVVDSTALTAHYAGAGYSLPAGSAVFAARIVDGAAHPGYQLYEAGDGAFDTSFWPASTIKVLSALAALEWVYAQGYTGAAQVDWDSGFGDRLNAIYSRAIRVSSNIDYDRTLRAAGWDFMNAEFLSPERGFPGTVITSSYASVEVRNPGGYTLTENGQSQYVAARAGAGDYGRNDTNLYELTEGLRRIMLDAEIPESERFVIHPTDAAGVQDALCQATPSYFANGAGAALGAVDSICHKPGWVPDNECLDHGLVTATDGSRYLIAASVPYQTNCPELSEVARHTLSFLAGESDRAPLQPDSGVVRIQRTSSGMLVEAEPPGTTVRAWTDGTFVGEGLVSPDGRAAIEGTLPLDGLLTVVAYDAAGDSVAARNAILP